MAILGIDLDAEQAAFEKEVAEVEAWWKTPRHAALKRCADSYPYYLVETNGDRTGHTALGAW
jgi:hypothetical protein